ncbi:hypothetical protein EB796_014841 [Bugula neritina]|uniref:Uncharacterized protein n=1 Tax=Bugula neritina TaxID=10212 RepID=A0A7J7JLE7_BUGNE|nr:hypothetical protein EB796_014841 [Bugula neritina]
MHKIEQLYESVNFCKNQIAEEKDGATEGEGETTEGETAAGEEEKKNEEEDEKAESADLKPQDETPQPTPPPPEINVDETHPEVKAIVENAIKLAEKQPINLSAEVTVDLVEAAIKKLRRRWL